MLIPGTLAAPVRTSSLKKDVSAVTFGSTLPPRLYMPAKEWNYMNELLDTQGKRPIPEHRADKRRWTSHGFGYPRWDAGPENWDPKMGEIKYNLCEKVPGADPWMNKEGAWIIFDYARRPAPDKPHDTYRLFFDREGQLYRVQHPRRSDWQGGEPPKAGHLEIAKEAFQAFFDVVEKDKQGSREKYWGISPELIPPLPQPPQK